MSLPFTIAVFSAVIAAIEAVAVAAQRKRSLARGAFAAGMAALAVESLCAACSAQANDAGGALRWKVAQSIATAASWVPWCLFCLHYSRQRKTSQRAIFLWLLAGVILPCVCFVARDELFVAVLPSELAFEPVLAFGPAGIALQLALLASCAFVLSNIERTFSSTAGTVRWRTKFMLGGVALVFATRFLASSEAILTGRLNTLQGVATSAGLLIGSLLMLRSLARAGHFETAVYPSPAALRSSATLLLAGAFLGVLLLVWQQPLFSFFSSTSLKITLLLVALSLVAIAAQSDRLRQKLTRLISVHLQRPVYDYRRVWRQFSEIQNTYRTPQEFCRALTGHVSRLLEAKSVAVWIVNESRTSLVCEASTAFAFADAPDGQVEATPADTGVLLGHFETRCEPAVFDDAREPWQIAAARLHPAQFRKGGPRLAIPLATHHQILGFLFVGDRLARGYGIQDMDMLGCLAEQAASTLLQFDLERHALRIRELSAFQTMASFFVHDLKNSASLLKMLLPNLRAHWSNPEFREDALRGIDTTVTRIDTLVRRLTLLRRGIELHPEKTDLNALVTLVLSEWSNLPDVRLSSDLGNLPPVWVDGEQLRSVLTNLLLNARDATRSTGAGSIQVKTRCADGCAVLLVQDNGCGMTREFIERSLFKPFTTTKTTGLGIGLFQSRMIVEAHKGRLLARSSPGSGTEFELQLPLLPAPVATALDTALLEESLP